MGVSWHPPQVGRYQQEWVAEPFLLLMANQNLHVNTSTITPIDWVQIIAME